MFIKRINQLPLPPLLILALTLGLAPFTPEPHLQEKIRMLLQGDLHKPIDIFDFIMHGLPVFLLILRLMTAMLFKKIKPN
jgi:hypothetical protein